MFKEGDKVRVKEETPEIMSFEAWSQEGDESASDVYIDTLMSETLGQEGVVSDIEELEWKPRPRVMVAVAGGVWGFDPLALEKVD